MLLFFLLFFILQKGCNQRSLERWYRVSHKTVQWPRRRGWATSKASTCSWLLELAQSPHCTAGHSWEPVAAPWPLPASPPNLLKHPAGPAWTHAWTLSHLMENGLLPPFCLASSHAPATARAAAHLCPTAPPDPSSPSILNCKGLCQAPSKGVCSASRPPGPLSPGSLHVSYQGRSKF